MAQFELLDALLRENGSEPVYTDTVNEKIMESYDEDSHLYADMDNLVEDAMREVLRSTILESGLEDEVKIDHITVVEHAAFTEEQVLNFMNESINPVLTLMSLYEDEENTNFESVAVSLPVFETVRELWSADGGKEFVTEMLQGKVPGESLYESIFGDDAYIQEDGDESLTLKEELADIFERYEIDTADERDDIINEAVQALEENEYENIVPSTHDLSDLVLSYNALHEVGEIEMSLNEALEYPVQALNEALGKKKEIRLDSAEGMKATQKKTEDALNQAKKAKDVKAAAKEAKPKKVKKVKPGVDPSSAKGMRNTQRATEASLDKSDRRIRREKITAEKLRIKQGNVGTGRQFMPGKGFMKKKQGPQIAPSNLAKLRMAHAGSTIKDVGRAMGRNKGKTGMAAVGVAAIATAASLIFRKKKSACKGLSGDEKLRCLKSAAMSGLQAASSQAKSCKTAKNPDRCMKGAQREIEKWKSKIANFG